MSSDQVILFALLLFVFVFLIWGRWRYDLVAFAALVIALLTGLVPADQAFSGFGSDTVILLLGLLVMTAALMRTGVVDVFGRRLLSFTSGRPALLLPATMVAVAALSAVINNTAAAALFLPIVLAMSRRAGMSPSRLLMRMAFAAILASSVTLISTSTNLVVSGLMTQAGLEPIGMFELTLVGLPILAVGLAYMVLVGQRLVPERPSEETLADRFGLRAYLAELHVSPGSPLAGRSLAESALGRDHDLTVIRVRRRQHRGGDGGHGPPDRGPTAGGGVL